MPNKTNEPQSKFSRLLAEVSGVSTRTARTSELTGLVDPVILLANNKCLLLPHIRSDVIPPIEERAATSDLRQLSKWATEFPRCGWALLTGRISDIIVLEAESEATLAAIRDLYRDEVSKRFAPDTAARRWRSIATRKRDTQFIWARSC